MKLCHSCFCAIITAALAGCGGSGPSAPPTAKAALQFGVNGTFTTLSSAKGVRVTAKLPAGVFPILSSASSPVVKPGLNALHGLGTATIPFNGSYVAATRVLTFDAVATDLANGSISGDFARLTYTASGTPNFTTMTTIYKVGGPGGIDLSHRVTQKSVISTSY